MHLIARFGCVCGLVLAALATGPAGANDSHDLVLNYRFDAGNGTAIDDSSSWQLDATLTGAGSTWTLGKWGMAVELTGAGDAVAVAAANSVFLNVPLVTATAWIYKAPGTAGLQTIVSKFASDGGGYRLALDAGAGTLLGSAHIAGADITVTGDTLIPDNTWTHVGLVYDGTQLRLFVDGVAETDVGNAVGTIDDSTVDISVGNEFVGRIDELQVYRRALSDSEIAANQAASAGEAALLFYEPFDSFSTALDNGVNVNAGGVTYTPTPLGNGLILNADTVISFPVAGNFDMARGSITFWVRPNWDGNGSGFHPLLQFVDASQSKLVINKTAWGATDYVWVNRDTDLTDALAGPNVSSTYMSPNPVESWVAGEWHFVEAHWDSTAGTPWIALLIDGTHIKTNHVAMDAAVFDAERFFFGAADLTAGFDGVLDEMRIYGAPQFDANRPYLRYAALTRHDGIQQPHETPANSPDGTILDPSVAPAQDIIFFEQPPYATVLESTHPVAGDVRTSMTYQAARGDTLSLFFNVHTRVELGETLLIIDDNALRNGADTLPRNPTLPDETLDLRVVRNWWQAGPSDWAPRLSDWGDYMPELIVNDDTTVVDISEWNGGAEDSGGGVLVPVIDELPSFSMGTPLVVDAKTNLSKHTSKQFVVTVEIPANAAPGTYSGNVSLEAVGRSADLPITLQVLDFELAANDKETMIYHRAIRDVGSCYNTNSSATKTPEEWCYELVTPENYQAELDDLAAHGINGLFNYNDPADLTDARNMVQQLIDAGIDRRIIFGHEFPAGGYGSYSTAAAQALSEQGLTPSFYGFDEPGLRNKLSQHLQSADFVHAMEIDDPQNPGTPINAGAQLVNAIFPNVAACLRDGGINTDPLGGCESEAILDNVLPTHQSIDVDPPTCSDTNANGDPICTPPYYPQLDVENIQTEENSATNRQYYEDLMNGLVTPPAYQTYYWQSRAEDPRMNRYYAGVFLYLTDAEGWMPYVYQHFGRETHPYNDYPDRYNMTTYPSQDGPIATLQWEAMRDGLNDYRYLSTWRAHHATMAVANPALASASAVIVDAAMAKYKLGRWSVMDKVSIGQFNLDREIVQAEIVALATSDLDGDGLTDLEESETHGTDPDDADSDNDNLTDGHEVLVSGTNPLLGDTDGDGITDALDSHPLNNTLPYAKGDVNGDVEIDIADLLLLQQVLTESETLDAGQVFRADLNDDDNVDIADLLLMESSLVTD